MHETPEIGASPSFHSAFDVAHYQLKELGNQSHRGDALPAKDAQQDVGLAAGEIDDAGSAMQGTQQTRKLRIYMAQR